MRTLMLTLATIACVGLAIPASAADRISLAQTPQLVGADDFSAAGKKKAVKSQKKKSGTTGSGGGGGGMWGG